MTEQLRKQLARCSKEAAAAQNSEMCLLTLIYLEEDEPAVLGIIQRNMTVARYTKIQDVQGARTDMLVEKDYDSAGQKQMLLIFAERAVIRTISDELRQLRRMKGHGLRGFITPVEDVI